MPRFFFHVRSGDDIFLDPDGSDLPNLNAAKNEALVGLRQLIVDRLRGGRHSDIQQIEIVDQTGQTLAMVDLEEALNSLQ